MKRLALAPIIFALGTVSAAATDWTGQPASFPPIAGITTTPGGPGGGSKSFYAPVGGFMGFVIDTLPAQVTAPTSNVFISVGGYYRDPTAPQGMSLLSGIIPLSDFATGSSVDALQSGLTGLGTQFAALSAQFATSNAQLAQALQTQARNSDMGVAQALAMAGTADLQADENYSVAFNVGTYGGQTAFAGGASVRVDQHVSVNAGFTAGTQGGPVGARAGIRFGW